VWGIKDREDNQLFFFDSYSSVQAGPPLRPWLRHAEASHPHEFSVWRYRLFTTLARFKGEVRPAGTAGRLWEIIGFVQRHAIFVRRRSAFGPQRKICRTWHDHAFCGVPPDIANLIDQSRFVLLEWSRKRICVTFC
jgi:hypothetical protein